VRFENLFQVKVSSDSDLTSLGSSLTPKSMRMASFNDLVKLSSLLVLDSIRLKRHKPREIWQKRRNRSDQFPFVGSRLSSIRFWLSSPPIFLSNLWIFSPTFSSKGRNASSTFCFLLLNIWFFWLLLDVSGIKIRF
jgi:hypothetical protein